MAWARVTACMSDSRHGANLRVGQVACAGWGDAGSVPRGGWRPLRRESIAPDWRGTEMMAGLFGRPCLCGGGLRIAESAVSHIGALQVLMDESLLGDIR